MPNLFFKGLDFVQIFFILNFPMDAFIVVEPDLSWHKTPNGVLLMNKIEQM